MPMLRPLRVTALHFFLPARSFSASTLRRACPCASVATLRPERPGVAREVVAQLFASLQRAVQFHRPLALLTRIRPANGSQEVINNIDGDPTQLVVVTLAHALGIRPWKHEFSVANIDAIKVNARDECGTRWCRWLSSSCS